MARTPTQTTAPAELMPADQQAEQQLVTLQDNAIVQHEAELNALAHSLGYQGSLTVGGLEDEIRFYQRRSVEALLECGKRLVLLKKITAHGEFEDRVEMLGFSVRTARRFMQAAAKITKSANLAVLSTQVKSASAFLELVTHDDDVLENLADMDAVEKMSASQLRTALRESREEKSAVEKVLTDKNATNDKLRAQLKRIDTLPANEALQQTMKEATDIANDAMGAIRGGVRRALLALNDVPEGTPNQAVFMAGLVGQIQADLNALREEFNLPDVSTAADAQLAAEVAQWAN